MEKEKIKQFIISQRENGIPDDQIHAFLVDKGAITIPQKSEPVKKPLAEKILDFTGGKEIAQGLGQSIANKDQVLAPGANLPNPFTGKVIEPKKGNATLLKETQESQIDIQGNILAKIRSDKAQGLDTSRLENALKMITEDLNATGAGAEKLLNQNELTNKEVIGDALQLATTASAGKVLGTANKIPINGVGVGMGAVKGATTGAIGGGVVGGLTGASQGLQENKTGKEILKDAGSGATIGAVTGGVLGAVVGGVSGGVKANKLRKENQYLDAITPKTTELTPTEYQDLLKKGKITPKTRTSPARYVLSEKEVETATKYKHLIGSKDPVKNSIKIMEEISKKDEEVGQFLEKNNGAFNSGELKNYLSEKMKDVTDINIDPTRLDGSKKVMIDNFVASLKKKNMKNLWTSRKTFDSKIDSAFSGSPSLQKDIKKALRNGVQDFIADRTPEGVYKSSMKEMTSLFDLEDIVTTKATKERGLNGIKLWLKNNPTKARIGYWGGGLFVGNEILQTLKN